MTEVLAPRAPSEYDDATMRIELDFVMHDIPSAAEGFVTCAAAVSRRIDDADYLEAWATACIAGHHSPDEEVPQVYDTARLGLVTGYLLADRAYSPEGVGPKTALSTTMPTEASMDVMWRYGHGVREGATAIAQLGQQSAEFIEELAWQYHPDNSALRLVFRESVGLGMARTQLALNRRVEKELASAQDGTAWQRTLEKWAAA